MKKGFTLIELLAVIVILAIIALIATPIILNIIEDSRKSAAIDSAKLYVDGLSKYIANRNLTTDFMPSSCVVGDTVKCDNIPLDYKVDGEKPTSGYINYANGIVTNYNVCVMNYKVVKQNGNITATKSDECNGNGGSTQPTDPTDPTQPQLTQYGFVTYDRMSVNTTTMAMTGVIIGTDGHTATGKTAYLKYNLTNGEVADGTVPVACIYSEDRGGELCIENNNQAGATGTAQRILDYFGFSETEWTKVDNYNWNDPTGTLSCNIVSFLATTCYDDNAGMSAYTSGRVLSMAYPHLNNKVPDAVTGKHHFSCYVDSDNSVLCE